MENINFMKKDYEEMIVAVKDAFSNVFRNYDLYALDKKYRKALLDREDIRLEIVEAAVDNYFYYTTHPVVREINDNKVEDFETYDDLCDELFEIAHALLIALLEKEVI